MPEVLSIRGVTYVVQSSKESEDYLYVPDKVVEELQSQLNKDGELLPEFKPGQDIQFKSGLRGRFASMSKSKTVEAYVQILGAERLVRASTQGVASNNTQSIAPRMAASGC